MALWAKYSSEGLIKVATEEHLMMAFEHVSRFVYSFSVCGPDPGVSEDRNIFPCPYNGHPRFLFSFCLTIFVCLVAIGRYGCIFNCNFKC